MTSGTWATVFFALSAVGTVFYPILLWPERKRVFKKPDIYRLPMWGAIYLSCIAVTVRGIAALVSDSDLQAGSAPFLDYCVGATGLLMVCILLVTVIVRGRVRLRAFVRQR
jgi:hypothetical protein